MSFRKYGGMNHNAKNNIVKNQYSNNVNQTVSNQIGLTGSSIVCQSNIDLSCNSLVNTSTIQFCDNTIQTTAYLGHTDEIYITDGSKDTFYIPFSNIGPGYESLYNSPKLYYDNSNNLLGTDVSGNASTATFATNASFSTTLPSTDSSTSIATTAFVQNTITNKIGNFSPPEVSMTSTTSSTEILFTWDIPTYNNVGTPFVYTLTNIYAYLYTTLNSSPVAYNSYSVLPDNAATYIQDVSGIVISTTPYSSSGNGYINNYSCIDGTTRDVFFYYNSDFLEMENDMSYNQLTLWYVNNYPYPNVGFKYYDAFSISGTPGQVYFTTASQSSYNSITLYCYVNQIDQTNPSSTASLTNYKIAANGYTSTGSTIRYPLPLVDIGPLSDVIISATSGTGTGSTHTTSFPLTSIYPSSPYTFNVAAKNNVNGNYGPIGTYTYTTENLTEPGSTIPSTLFNVSGFSYDNSNSNIFLVSSQALVTDPVVNITLVTGNNFINNSFITPVQTSNNLGLTNSDQTSTFLTITGEVSESTITSTSTQNIHGFDTSVGSGNPYTATYLSTNSNITISTSVYDNYSSGSAYNQGFYLMTDIQMNIGSGALTSTNNLYTASLSTSQVGTGATSKSASYSFYCDDVNANPSFNSLGGFDINNNNNNYYSILLSGIYVMYENPTFTITDLSLNNMGDYFYNHTLVTYTITGGATGTVSETDLTHTNYNSGTTLPTPLSFTNPSVSATISTSYSKSIILSQIVSNNIYGSTTTPLTNQIDIIVDLPSYTLVYSTLAQTIQTINSSTTKYGYRVWSPAPITITQQGNSYTVVPYTYIQSSTSIPNNTATGSTPATANEGYISTPYNNIWDIHNNSLTNQELLVANGHFTTSSTYYLNYSTYINNSLDYSSLSGTKYATFAWKLGSGIYTSVSIIINFSSQLYSNGTFYYTDSSYSGPIGLYIRFEDNDNVTYFDSSNLDNTTWISLNSNTGSNYQLSSSNFYLSNNILWSSPTVTNSNTTYTFKTNVNISVSSSQNITLYSRISIPNSYNGFNNIQAIMN
jgi:hypothetical protein